jgi:1,4-alpha-glucan branching enzyme
MSKLEKDRLFEYYAPGAKEVHVAGTFSDWDPEKHLLIKQSGGWWRLTLKLRPGRYEYRYLVDENWENDQRPVVCVPNPYGSWNCVVEVS